MNDHFRSKPLLRLSYEIPCTLRIRGVCEGGVGEPCHSNQSRHGKGGSIKAHDCFYASGCRSCHRELDHGKRFTREEKADLWQRAFEETLLQLWQRGLIKVA